MQKTEFKTRPPKASDLNFIFASFSNSVRRESDLGRSCRSGIFFTEFQKIIDLLLNSCSILIACSPDEENAIIGYLIYKPGLCIHYAFTRPSSRGFGIAKELIREAFPGAKEWTFTLNTNMAKKISKSYPELTYNPFILFKKGE